ncbi:MAG: TRAP transporter small permease [Syntrophales bacterium]|nr:TRAP transporter small permease [Syntrophales bacterium]
MAHLLFRLNSLAIRFADFATVIFLSLIAILIPGEVFCRYILGTMPAWFGELAVFSLVWLTMMGTASAFKRGYLIAMEFLVKKLQPGVRNTILTISLIFTNLFFAIMTYFSVHQTLINWHQKSPALGIPMAFPYSALPIGFGIMFSVSLEILLTNNFKKNHQEYPSAETSGTWN